MEAAWIPFWYELDQPIEVGLAKEFAFWRVVPDYLGPEPLVFHNGPWRRDEVFVARGSIKTISHSELGAVRKVDTRGLDYTITLTDGTELTVNAEEEPGELYERSNERWEESSHSVSDWKFVVEFDSLGELLPANR